MVANGTLSNYDEAFVKQFLVNGNITVPKESMLLETDSIKDLFSTLKANKTYCFSTEHGSFGWCATCDLDAREFEKGHCGMTTDGKPAQPRNPEELIVPSISKVYGC